MARQQAPQTSHPMKGNRSEHSKGQRSGRPKGHRSEHLKGTRPEHPSRQSGDTGNARPSGGNGPALLDERQRREMIATAAFLRAQRRGFESGSELEDWLAAEEEIDRWLRQVDRGSQEPPLFEE